MSDEVLRRLADCAAIQDLVARYAIAVDDLDYDAIANCFAPDGEFVRSGTLTASGREALREFYRVRQGRTTMSVHIVNSLVIDFGADAEQASGLQTGQALLGFPDGMMHGAFRYHDRYVRVDGQWCFARRELRFGFLVPAQQLDLAATSDLRVRWPDTEPAPADL